MKKKHILDIEPNSIAEEMGIEKGDFLVSVNGSEIIDVFDYRYLISDEYLEVLIEKADGEEWLLEIDKDESEDLGIVFDDGLMDNMKICANKCIFCFIDQLPKGMRKTLYVKDDDSRLSFLQGNYATLTNMSDKDFERIINYHLSPINISVHATGSDLRCSMMKNKKAGNIAERMKMLYNANIDMNFQIVLCKGVNDAENLDKSIADLAEFIPRAKSLSVVPVGITKFRGENNLYELEPFDKKDSLQVIAQVEKWQNKLLKEKGTRFVFAADEFYLQAEANLPDYESYEDFPQLENGVGMLSLFENQFNEYLAKINDFQLNKKITLATGVSAYEFIKNLSAKLCEKVEGLDINVVKIENNFFGEHITVSGLLTGTDIINQLKQADLGEMLILPENLLKSGESVLLDDITLDDISSELGIPVFAVSNNPQEFIEFVLDINDNVVNNRRRNKYEQ